MSTIAVIILRTAQAAATMVEVGLASYVSYVGLMPSQPCITGEPGATADCGINGSGLDGGVGIFVLVKCAWTLLTLVVLSLVPICMTVPPFLLTTLDGLAMLLWLAGAISLAILAAGTNAISDVITVFEFIIWALFTATFVISLTTLFRRVRGIVHKESTSDTSREPSNTSGNNRPHMSASRNNMGFVGV